ncbi:MAG: sulfite exporter TauE/SafE family protein [Clostridia bacterium]|nr:sulfite exporter TauE/SafE family protein [Clostridia bacterium]
MKKINFNKIKFYLGSLSIGLSNAMFGAGGGIFAVWLLKELLPDNKRAHAAAVAVVLCVAIISAAGYLKNGYVQFSDALFFIPGGVLGAILGTYILNKISPRLLKKIFGIFMLWAGIRLIRK